MRLFAAILAFSLPLLPQESAPPRAQQLARQIQQAGLDPSACYRVRELNLTREDLRLYFTEGHLLFGKPVNGRRLSALFLANVEGGDAELLVLPPSRGERASLAKFAQTPNLNEHFQSALMVFTDDTAEALMEGIRSRGEPVAVPEMGHALSAEWGAVASNLEGSFLTRIVHHLLSGAPASDGFFYAALRGVKLGNFDVLYDPFLPEQIFIGQMAYLDGKAYYDTWANYPARSFRSGERRLHEDPFAVTNYRIEARMDGDLRLSAVTQMTVTVRSGPLAVLAFDLSAGMRVTAVRVNGEEAEFYARESLRADLIRRNATSTFLVIPANPLEAGRHYDIDFEHEGSVVSAAGKQIYYVGGRGNWYPQSGWNFARYDITFTYPAHLQLVFPGELREDSTEGEWRTTRRRTGAPIRLAGFNLGDYETARVRRGGLTVEVFANREVEESLKPQSKGYVVVPPPAPAWPRRGATLPQPMVVVPVPEAPPNPVARLQTLADEVASAFEFFSGHFGPPSLPLLMVSPVPGTFGQGFPGLVYLSTLSYLEARQRPQGARGEQQETFFSELLHAHETAHQWWGNVVTSRGNRDEWLMEALANYSALMVLERKKGARAAETVLERYKLHLLAKDASGRTLDSAGPIHWGSRLHSSQNPEAWRVIMYEKGSWIIHMLRRRMGDEAFLRMLGELCRRYRYQAIGVKEFRDLAAEFLPGGNGAMLDQFMEHWVESTGIPTVRVRHSMHGKAPRLESRVTVEMSGVEEGTALMVPVEFQYRSARPETHWIKAETGGTVKTFKVRQAPVKVVADPRRSVLAVYP